MILSKPKRSTSPVRRSLGMPIKQSRTGPGTLQLYTEDDNETLKKPTQAAIVREANVRKPITGMMLLYSEDETSAKSTFDQYTESFESAGEDTYSNTFISATDKLETVHSSKHDTVSFVPEYSETFESTAVSDSRSDTASDTYSDESYTRSRTEYFSDVSMGTETEMPTHTDSGTRYDYTSFEDTSRFEEATASQSYDYSYTFEATDGLDDTEKLRKQAEEEALSKEAAEEFASSMITHLKEKRIKESDLSNLAIPETETEKVDHHTMKFLKKKIKQLKLKKRNGGMSPDVAKDTEKHSVETKISHYGLHPRIVEHLKIKNILKNMENAAKVEIHDPKRCRECRIHSRKIEESAAKRNFIREKTRYVRQEIIEKRISQHLVTMDGISLIGELARSLPRHTDDPELILEQLNKGLSFSRSTYN